MSMIPDAGPPAQPTELYRVDVYIGETKNYSETFTATTDDEATATAYGIAKAQGGDHGDIYLHVGADRSTYYDTVAVK